MDGWMVSNLDRRGRRGVVVVAAFFVARPSLVSGIGPALVAWLLSSSAPHSSARFSFVYPIYPFRFFHSSPPRHRSAHRAPRDAF